MSRTILLFVATAALACDRSDVPTQAVLPRSVPLSDRTATASLQAVEDAGGREVHGSLSCALEGQTLDGPWSLYGWRLTSADRRDDRALPLGAPLFEVELESSGPYRVALPVGPRRFLVARHHGTGTLAWTDPHARAFPVPGDLEHVDLTCVESITPAPDGSVVVASGDPIPEAYEPEEQPEVALEDTPIGKARPSRFYNEARIGDGPGVHTEQAIQQRYQGEIDDNHLRAMMPLLMQLADDPKAADELVASTRKQLSGGSGSPSGSAAPSQSAGVGIIETTPSHYRRSR